MCSIKIELYKLLFLILIISGSNSKAQDAVPYQLAKNYFVNNTYPDKNIHAVKISSSKEFNEIFGMATTMGNEGKPTEINFTKNFAIAVIDAVSTDTEIITIESLTDERKKLNLRYNVIKKTVPNSASFRVAKILIISKKFKAKLVAELVKNSSKIKLVKESEEDLKCYPSVIFTWSILEEKCIEPISTKYTFIGKNFNANGNAGLQFNRKNTQAEIMDSSLNQNLILNKEDDKDIWTDGNYKKKKKRRFSP